MMRLLLLCVANSVNSSLALLGRPREVEQLLHFDEFPILYIGTNKYGNKIIGSHLEEDDESKTILTLHTLLTNKEFYQFMTGRISYLEIFSTKFWLWLYLRHHKYI